MRWMRLDPENFFHGRTGIERGFIGFFPWLTARYLLSIVTEFVVSDTFYYHTPMETDHSTLLDGAS